MPPPERVADAGEAAATAEIPEEWEEEMAPPQGEGVALLPGPSCSGPWPVPGRPWPAQTTAPRPVPGRFGTQTGQSHRYLADSEPQTALLGPQDRPYREDPPFRTIPGPAQDRSHAVLERRAPPETTLQWINASTEGEQVTGAIPTPAPGDGGPPEGQAHTPANTAGEVGPDPPPTSAEPGARTPPDHPGPLGYQFRLPATEMAADPEEEEEADYASPDEEEEEEDDDISTASPLRAPRRAIRPP